MVEPQHLRCIITYSYSSDVGLVGGATTFFFWSRRQSCRRGPEAQPIRVHHALVTPHSTAPVLYVRAYCAISSSGGPAKQQYVARFLQWSNRIRYECRTAARMSVHATHVLFPHWSKYMHACFFFLGPGRDKRCFLALPMPFLASIQRVTLLLPS